MEFPHNMLPGSLELAYIGDAVYELYVRKTLLSSGGHVRNLHKKAIALVCCEAQAQALERIEASLTDEEADIVRRARNAHQSPPKRAEAAVYHRATALEALIGYLYLTNQTTRMEELLQLAIILRNEGTI